MPSFPDAAAEIIRIHPRRVIGFNIDPERPELPGPSVRDVGTGQPQPGRPDKRHRPDKRREEWRTVADADGDRPVLGASGLAADGAAEAVQGLVAELQAGLDARDADVYNRHFAADVIWGSPFGATVTATTGCMPSTSS